MKRTRPLVGGLLFAVGFAALCVIPERGFVLAGAFLMGFGVVLMWS